MTEHVPRKRITIGEVASAAGVHPATVSRALNPGTQHQVSPETVRRVKRVAQQLGYVPDIVARGMRTRQSMTIGVIIPDITNPLFPPIVRGIESFLRPLGYTALLANTDGDEAVEVAVFDSLMARRVDGFIVATGRMGEQPLLKRAYDNRVLAVMVNRLSGGAPYPLVTGDDASGIVASLAHLFALGHRDVLHIAGPMDLSTSRVRADAFRAIVAAEPDVTGRVREATALTVEAGKAAMDEELAGGAPHPTAVIAGNDLLAIGVMRSLREHGLRCPEDVSVVGFNDMPFAEDLSPSLTTVHVPMFDIGVESARLLLRGIESETQDAVTVSLPVSLVVRQSTGPAPS